MKAKTLFQITAVLFVGVLLSNGVVHGATETACSQPATSGQTNQPVYPWVVYGQVTDAAGNGMPDVSVSASCGRGSLMPTGSTQTDAQGNYRLRFGPALVWHSESGRVDVAKTTENTVLQAAIIGAGKPGYYEKNLWRQGDLRMARRLPPPGERAQDDAERIILPDQPKRVDFVMLPAASIRGRVVDAHGKALTGQRFYVCSDHLPPGAQVLCEFRPDEQGDFKVSDAPCQSYWLEVADGDLRGVRSNTLTISNARLHEVVISFHKADKQLRVERVSSPATAPSQVPPNR